jgi:hypothetical protein
MKEIHCKPENLAFLTARITSIKPIFATISGVGKIFRIRHSCGFWDTALPTIKSTSDLRSFGLQWIPL